MAQIYTQNIKQKGIALVEILVGVAIITTAFVSILSLYASMTKVSKQAIPRVQAAMLAEETLEAARAMRDAGYASSLGLLSSNVPYYLSWSTASSTFTTTIATSSIDGLFYRTMTVSPTYRDSSFNLASSGTLDTNTKLITATVKWNTGSGTTTYTLQSYVANIFNN